VTPDGRASSTGFATALAQAALLVALISVPLFADPLSSRGFQEDRIVLLRLLGTLGLGVLIVRPARARGLGFIGVGLALYLLASTVSAWFSEEPIAAWRGAYLRQAGWQTDLGLAGILLAASTLASRRALSELAVQALLLCGAVSSILALFQTAGLPVPFLLPGTRSGGFTGGPTYLGSCLAALLPIALARISEGRAARAHIALSVLLLLGLLASASRAALLAALCGAALVGVWRGRARLVLGSAAALLLVGALFCLPFVRARLPADALPNRLVSDALGDQLRERALLYRDGLAALSNQGVRLWIGRGPDTIGNRFTAEISEDLQHRLGGKVRVDRLHSDPLDLIYTRGILAALGLILLVAGGLRIGHRAARAPPAAGTALCIGLSASLLANFIDGALSVPGAGSRLLLFFAAGWLAGWAASEREPREAAPPAASSLVGLLTGAGLAVVLFAVSDLRQAWLALPLLLLLRRSSGKLRALFAAAALVLPFLALHLALDPSGARVFSASGPGAFADRARLDLVLLLLTLLAAVAGVAFVRFREERTSGPGGRSRLSQAALALLLLFFLNLAYHDARRLLADVNARAALDAQLRGGKPAAAARLLEDAIEWAPEVAEYRKLAILAYTDEAHGGQGRAPSELLQSTGAQVARILADHPRDAFALAQSARCLIEFGRLLPQQAHGLTQRALKFAERALRAAPFATPVLHVAAEVLIESGDLDRAALLLDRSISIDRREARGLLLRGRGLAAKNDLEGAAHFYGLANDSGAGKNECLAALIIAAGATGRVEDAATLAMLLADRVPNSPRLEFEVAGARPLLRHLRDNHFKELFDHAERIYRGRPENLARVRAALDY